MRAGFHKYVVGEEIDLVRESQSLVNEGRFPRERKVQAKEKETKNHSHNPSLMRAGFHNGLCQKVSNLYGSTSCRNPSLMRAGFHKKVIVGTELLKESFVAIPR